MPPPAVPVYAPPNVDQVLLSISSYVISKVLCIAYARSINLGRKDNIDLNKIVPSDRDTKHMVVHNFQVDCMLKRLHQSLFGQRYDKGNLGYPIKWFSSCQMGGTRNGVEATNFGRRKAQFLSLAPRSEESEKAGF